MRRGWADGGFSCCPMAGLANCALPNAMATSWRRARLEMPTVGLGEAGVHCLDEYGYQLRRTGRMLVGTRNGNGCRGHGRMTRSLMAQAKPEQSIEYSRSLGL